MSNWTQPNYFFFAFGESLVFYSAGLTTSNTQLPRLPHSPMSTDPSLSSDMLMSLNMGGLGPEMSVRQSLHIGVAPGDLQLDTICLPSNEEMAKGECISSCGLSTIIIRTSKL